MSLIYNNNIHKNVYDVVYQMTSPFFNIIICDNIITYSALVSSFGIVMSLRFENSSSFIVAGPSGVGKTF